MNYELTSPCGKCPFRTDIPPFLTKARAVEIASSLTDRQQTFPCHATIDYSHDDDGRETPNTQHCAGALIMLECMEQPNQMMRICERLGMYDRNKLKMDAPVCADADEFVMRHVAKRGAKP